MDESAHDNKENMMKNIITFMGFQTGVFRMTMLKAGKIQDREYLETLGS